jgi:UDP-N-acetylmuramoyl-tripeptide--D-alanyl-D-alanine ligase
MISMRLSEAASQLEGKLSGKDVQFTGCSIDSRSIKAGNLFIALRGEKFDGHDFVKAARDNGACAALVERDDDGDTLPLLIIKDAKLAMARLAGHWREGFTIPLIAVTGSNGKTTVKEMLGSILGLNASVLVTSGNLNNDIGVPLTLFGLGGEHRYAVIEMGANHPGEIAGLTRLARPSVAVITQCAPAHLQGFGSVDGVARAKAEIYSGLVSGGTAVINADDNYAGFWRGLTTRYKQISFGMKNTADVTASDVRFDTETGKTGFSINTPAGAVVVSISLAGSHNVMNSLAAAACCVAVGVSLKDIKQGLERITGVHGRMEMLHTRAGARIFDDTYNANPVSLQAGLEVLARYPGRLWLVLGDMGELGDYSADLHRQAGEAAREQGIERIYALGQYSRYAVQGFGNGARHFGSMEDLVRSVKSDLSGDVTLLVKGSRFMGMETVVKSLLEET